MAKYIALLIFTLAFIAGLYDGFNKNEGLPVVVIIMIGFYAIGFFLGYGSGIIRSCF